jgi:hypothetical protein
MAENHHYVPQFLLRNFLSGDKRRLWVYDKSSGRSFETTEKNVASERDFYAAKVPGGTISAEQGLSALETKAAAVIGRLLGVRSLGCLSDDERTLLAVFTAVQMVRVPYSRAVPSSILESVRAKLEQWQHADLAASLPSLTADAVKAQSLLSFDTTPQLAAHLLDKTWLLFETEASTSFYISDNPVVMQNSDRSGKAAGDLGLAVQGIEVYFPLSSTLLLAFYCRSHERNIRRGTARVCSELARSPTFQLDPSTLLRWTRAFRTGDALPSTADNVLNQNSLQVQSAERYIFSSAPDFSLVRDMIADNPRFRTGPRPEVV